MVKEAPSVLTSVAVPGKKNCSLGHRTCTCCWSVTRYSREERAVSAKRPERASISSCSPDAKRGGPVVATAACRAAVSSNSTRTPAPSGTRTSVTVPARRTPPAYCSTRAPSASGATRPSACSKKPTAAERRRRVLSVARLVCNCWRCRCERGRCRVARAAHQSRALWAAAAAAAVRERASWRSRLQRSPRPLARCWLQLRTQRRRQRAPAARLLPAARQKEIRPGQWLRLVPGPCGRCASCTEQAGFATSVAWPCAGGAGTAPATALGRLADGWWVQLRQCKPLRARCWHALAARSGILARDVSAAASAPAQQDAGVPSISPWRLVCSVVCGTP